MVLSFLGQPGMLIRLKVVLADEMRRGLREESGKVPVFRIVILPLKALDIFLTQKGEHDNVYLHLCILLC